GHPRRPTRDWTSQHLLCLGEWSKAAERWESLALAASNSLVENESSPAVGMQAGAATPDHCGGTHKMRVRRAPRDEGRKLSQKPPARGQQGERACPSLDQSPECQEFWCCQGKVDWRLPPHSIRGDQP